MTTREQWLVALAEKMAPWFGELPPIRVSVGFTSAGSRGKRVGECWSKDCSEDGACHIFIHPGQADTLEVAAILAHELVHAAVGHEAKHGPVFKKMAHRIGLEGPMKSTRPGEGFKTDVAPLLAEIGPIPHVPLVPKTQLREKQTTRMLKCECSECGYIVRTTQKWLDVATPTCPVCHLTMEVG